jgi:organic hydroperoxide reductase OsmC/OhrA
MSTPAGSFTIAIEQVKDYEFRVRFDKETYPDLIMDEPPPLGGDIAPNPSRMLAAAIGDCLSASLVFCLRRSKIEVLGLAAELTVTLVRNEQKRLRIGSIDVRLHPKLAEDTAAYRGCLDAFEDFCVVTQSVREGLEVRVQVEPTFTANS